jgi:hypothetical protein
MKVGFIRHQLDGATAGVKRFGQLAGLRQFVDRASEVDPCRVEARVETQRPLECTNGSVTLSGRSIRDAEVVVKVGRASACWRRPAR